MLASGAVVDVVDAVYDAIVDAVAGAVFRCCC